MTSTTFPNRSFRQGGGEPRADPACVIPRSSHGRQDRGGFSLRCGPTPGGSAPAVTETRRTRARPTEARSSPLRLRGRLRPQKRVWLRRETRPRRERGAVDTWSPPMWPTEKVLREKDSHVCAHAHTRRHRHVRAHSPAHRSGQVPQQQAQDTTRRQDGQRGRL